MLSNGLDEKSENPTEGTMPRSKFRARVDAQGLDGAGQALCHQTIFPNPTPFTFPFLL